MTTPEPSPSPEALAAAELLPCRICGAPCSVQHVEGPNVRGSLWLCSNSVRLGGTCQAAAAVSKVVWNSRPASQPADAVGSMAINDLALHNAPSHLSEDERLAELHRLYNYADDDSRQFTRWQMSVALAHGYDLASAAIPVPPASGTEEAPGVTGDSAPSVSGDATVGDVEAVDKLARALASCFDREDIWPELSETLAELLPQFLPAIAAMGGRPDKLREAMKGLLGLESGITYFPKEIQAAALARFSDARQALQERPMIEPCPFCQSDGVVVHPLPPSARGLHDLISQAPYYVHCDSCGADGPNHDTEAEAIAAWNQRPQPPAPYGKVHTDGSRSGGMPPGTNARPPAATPGTDGKDGTAPANPMGQPPAPQDEPMFTPQEEADLVDQINGSFYLQPNPPQDDLVEELPQPLKDLLHHIVQCMVAEGCGEISAWESIKTIWPAITDYFAPIIAERDAALAKLERAEHDLAVMAVEYPKVCDKLAAAEVVLRKYGKHDHDCNKNRAARWGAGEPGCICGLRAALATEKQP